MDRVTTCGAGGGRGKDVVVPLLGRTALVTGGGRDVGCETALALGRLGADVLVVHDADGERAVYAVNALEEMGRSARAVRVDLIATGATEEVAAEVDDFIDEAGRDRLDILVTAEGTRHLGTLDAVSGDERRAGDAAVSCLIQALTPHMTQGGRIVAVGADVPSGHASGPMEGVPRETIRRWARALGPRGITVNAVAPGPLIGDRATIARDTALGRVGTPAEIAGVVAFLCGPDAGSVTGTVIPVDGGYRM